MQKQIKEKLFHDVKSILEKARSKTYSAINFHMIKAYWNIGQSLVETEQLGLKRAEYGKALIKDLRGIIEKKEERIKYLENHQKELHVVVFERGKRINDLEGKLTKMAIKHGDYIVEDIPGG